MIVALLWVVIVLQGALIAVLLHIAKAQQAMLRQDKEK